MPYLDHIRALNRWNPENFLPLMVDDLRMGWVRHAFAEQLAGFPDCFDVTSGHVALNRSLEGVEARSEAVAEVLEHLVETGVIRHLQGEMYPVVSEYGKPTAFQIDRAVVSQFGIRAFGQHLNGYVQSGQGMMMWVGRRASDRRVFPDRLDQLVAGGLPHAITLQENLIKECREEAGIASELAASAISVGAISYCCEVERGLRDDTLFCYDLLLPEAFTPRCTDGEVGGFELMPVEKVAEIVRSSEAFKPNCNLVIIDFLLRHGFIDPDHQHYQKLSVELNRSGASEHF